MMLKRPIDVAAVLKWLAVTFATATVAILALSFFLARNVEREHVEDLRAEVDRNTDLNACRARFGLAITDAQAEGNIVFWELLAVSVVDSDYDRDAAVAELRRIATDLRAAKDARLAYEQTPILPCPIAAPQSSEGD